jgi:hypothetical protein
MTHTTEQERASLRAFIEMAEREGFDTAHQWYEAKGWVFFSPSTADCWRYWQAARRAPAVPVPQFNHTAKRKLNILLGAGEEITGYAFQNKDGRRGSIDCHGFVAWWQDAAALQPPEAAQLDDTNVADMAQAVDSKEAAPVQLPEPVAKIEGGSLKWHIPDAGYSLPVRYLQGTQMLYTEQQVRQLLAAHGIKVAP